jgi:hypothetical protein
MIAARHCGCLDDGTRLVFPGADEEYDASTFGDSLDNLGCSAKMCGCLVERYYMDTITDSEDVTRIGRIPERCRMAQMCLRGEEELKSDVGYGGRFVEELIWLICIIDLCAKGPYLVHYTPCESCVHSIVLKGACLLLRSKARCRAYFPLILPALTSSLRVVSS